MPTLSKGLSLSGPCKQSHRLTITLLACLVIYSWGRPARAADDYDLHFSTYAGGAEGDMAHDVEIDRQGNIYITGGTASPDFPTTPGAYDRTFNGLVDTFVMKLGPDGRLIWSTYLGGPGYDRAYAVEVDGARNVYVGGRGGAGYPTTSGVVQEKFGGGRQTNFYGYQDGAIAKFDPDGRLLWSTYFGPDDDGYFRDIEVDAQGNVYGGFGRGERANPHITPGAYDTTMPTGGKFGVPCKISADGKTVLWASYLGSDNSADGGWTPSVVVDSGGNLLFGCGVTGAGMPTTPGAYDQTFGGGWDGYIAKFNQDGSDLIFATYLGGSNLEGIGRDCLVLDGAGNIAFQWTTRSTDLWTSPNAFQKSYGGSGGSGTGKNTNYDGDGYVGILSPDGSKLLAATYLGGSVGDGCEGTGGFDTRGNLYVSGTTYSKDFPVTANAFQSAKSGGADIFVCKLSPDLSTLLYSSFLGGSGDDLGRTCAVDAAGTMIVAGTSQSSNYPLLNAFDTLKQGLEAIVTKLSLAAPSPREIGAEGRVDVNDLAIMALHWSEDSTQRGFYLLHSPPVYWSCPPSQNSRPLRHPAQQTRWLIVFEVSDPFGPVFALDAAGLGPGAFRVELRMPFECPQLFEPYLSYRPIQEKGVYMPIVTVYAEALHIRAAVAIRSRRPIGRPRASVRPLAVQKGRNPVLSSEGEDVPAGRIVAGFLMRTNGAGCQPPVEPIAAEKGRTGFYDSPSFKC